jgi:hypothetical protein
LNLPRTYPLFELSWFAVPLISKSHPELNDLPDRQPTFATSDQIKAAIQGRLAIVGFLDSDPTVGPHALAWDGNRAIDCIAGEIVALDDIEALDAMLLIPIDAVLKPPDATDPNLREPSPGSQ